MARSPLSGRREIPVTGIRPENRIVLDLMDFTPDDIAEVIEQGRSVAKKVLNR